MKIWSPALPPRPGCPHRRLTRLLMRELPCGLTLGATTLRPWASANFVGARHLFPCDGAADDRARLQQQLAAVQWSLPGHIVADIAVETAGDDGGLRIEILTVED